MTKLNNKVFTYLLALTCVLFLTCNVYANDADDICIPKKQSKIIVGFFNGVMTDDVAAEKGLKEIKKLNLATSNNEIIEYEVFYNETKGIFDFIEVFDQRAQEYKQVLVGRYEYMRILNSSHKWWERMQAKGLMLSEFLNAVQNAMLEIIIDNLKLISNNPTAQDYAKHNNRIDNHILEGNKLLFVAHSQGNLFVNHAHKYALSKLPINTDTNKKVDAIKTVHIAPASLLLNGEYVLADKDRVINGFKAVNKIPNMPPVSPAPDAVVFVPPVTHNIPSYKKRPAGSNGQTDILGHGLIEIYLNDKFASNLSTYIPIKQYLQNNIAQLQNLPKQASDGFLTVTLTWDGEGDVDLHVFEPNGEHVYFVNLQGKSGELDFDNVVANGPEHYVIACDKSKIALGNYQIKVANFKAAQGRTATVALSTNKYGTLGFKQIKLGSETGINPAYLAFNFNVNYDNKGNLQVNLQK